MVKKLTLLVLVLVSPFWSSGSAAGEYCWNESIQFVILQGGYIYFTTNKSCPSWCRVDEAWSAEQQRQAYAMLLTAKAQDRPLTFYWAEHSAPCAGPVPPNSKPGTILIA